MCDLFQMDRSNAELSLPITDGGKKCIGSTVVYLVKLSPFSGQKLLFSIKKDLMGSCAGHCGIGCFCFLNCSHWGR